MAAPRSCSSISSQFVQFSHEKMMLPSSPVLTQAHLSSEILASPNPNSLKQRSNQKDRESEWFALFFWFGSHLVPCGSLSETIFDCSYGNKEMRGLAGPSLLLLLSFPPLSLHVKYKLFLSAMEYLPFSPGDDDPRASLAKIIKSVLLRSREIKFGEYDRSVDVAEQHRLQSLEKAMVIQWLCFTPPSTVNDAQTISGKLLLLALIHSNILFREFALISMGRVPAMPIGAHKLLSFLAEPLKQPPEDLLSIEDHDVSDCLSEFKDWVFIQIL